MHRSLSFNTSCWHCWLVFFLDGEHDKLMTAFVTVPDDPGLWHFISFFSFFLFLSFFCVSVLGNRNFLSRMPRLPNSIREQRTAWTLHPFRSRRHYQPSNRNCRRRRRPAIVVDRLLLALACRRNTNTWPTLVPLTLAANWWPLKSVHWRWKNICLRPCTRNDSVFR